MLMPSRRRLVHRALLEDEDIPGARSEWLPLVLLGDGHCGCVEFRDFAFVYRSRKGKYLSFESW